jgi:hypothetical protein
LDAGANPSLANLGGHKPIDYANSDAMRKLLENYIMKVTDPINKIYLQLFKCLI